MVIKNPDWQKTTSQLFTSLAEDLNSNQWSGPQNQWSAQGLWITSPVLQPVGHTASTITYQGKCTCSFIWLRSPKAGFVCMMAIKQICVILNINFNVNIQSSSLWKNWEVKAFIKRDQTVTVELEFGSVSEERGKISQSKGANQQQTQTTYGVEAGI